MSFIIKVHGKNEATEKMMKHLLELASEHSFMDVYSESEPNSDLLPAIEARLTYLQEHKLEQLRNLAKCELIRRKMTYKRISKFPPRTAYSFISERNSLFYIPLL